MQVFVRTTSGAITCVNLPEGSSIDILAQHINPLLEQSDVVFCRGGRSSFTLEDGCIIDMSGKLLGGAGPPAKTQMDPAFVALADKFNINKMVCRKCYATNPAKAKTCRKRKCGRCANLRPKKVSKD